MAVVFRLPGDIQEQYGLPEEVSFDFNQIAMSEAIDLEDALDMPIEDMLNALNSGKRNLRVWKAVIWIAARRAGADVSYADFDFNLLGLTTTDSEAAVEQAAPKAASGRSTRTRKSASPESA